MFARALRGDADAQHAISAVMAAPVPGSGIETHTDEERALVAQMIGAGSSAAEIQTALAFYRDKGRKPNTRERRNLPGIALMSTRLSIADGQWLTEGLKSESGALIPRQIAEKMLRQRFRSFDAFREAFWKAVSSVPEILRQFTDFNQEFIKRGSAPVAPRQEQTAQSRVWQLHHQPSIGEGGPVYDLARMRVQRHFSIVEHIMEKNNNDGF